MFHIFKTKSKSQKKYPLYRPGRPYKYVPSREDSPKPPKLPGEYRVLDKHNKILYIGETNNLRRRINEHKRSGKIKTSARDNYTVEYKIANLRSSSYTRRLHEQKKIKEHKPLLNKSKGGEGRISGKK